jgi:hypothetical protein
MRSVWWWGSGWMRWVGGGIGIWVFEVAAWWVVENWHMGVWSDFGGGRRAGLLIGLRYGFWAFTMADGEWEWLMEGVCWGWDLGIGQGGRSDRWMLRYGLNSRWFPCAAGII